MIMDEVSRMEAAKYRQIRLEEIKKFGQFMSKL